MYRFTALAFILFAAGATLAQTPLAIERDLLQHIDNISKYGNYGGGYDDERLTRNNADLKAKLIRYGNRVDILRYSFSKLSEKMNIVTSKDGRLRIYSWDRETGGTMHDFDSVFQYRGTNGKIFTWSENSDDESAGVFYHQIFQTETVGGPVYLGVSTFIGSTSLSGQTIRVFKISGVKLDRNAKFIRTASGITNSISFEYDFFSVVDRPERPIKLFTFDEKGKSFRFPVVIQDSETPQGRVTDKFIKYKFDGKYFVKVS